MSQDSLVKKLEDALVARKIDVNNVAGTFNVKQGTGPLAVKANIDPGPFVEKLAEAPPEQQDRLAAGWASGVKTVLLEPKRSKASGWTFEQTAGRIFPSMEVWSYVDGVRAATDGDDPFVVEFPPDLVIAYKVRLDMGIRPLTMSQFDGWSATRDRVTSAGRSMLFHETRNVPWREVDDFEGVFKLSRGDGFDAARALVFEDAFFGEVDKKYRFALPTSDLFYFVKSDDAASIAQLKEATIAAWSDADYPLSTLVFSFVQGRPTPAEH
jgi:hypothetical protein